jgi:hypothetical protein
MTTDVRITVPDHVSRFSGVKIEVQEQLPNGVWKTTQLLDPLQVGQEITKYLHSTNRVILTEVNVVNLFTQSASPQT